MGVASGAPVESTDAREDERAPELRARFAHHVDGKAPSGVEGQGSEVGESGRGSHADEWPIVEADWGTVAAWSWVLSRVVDALEDRPELDLGQPSGGDRGP